MLKEIKIMPALVSKKVECQKTGKKKKKNYKNKHNVSQNLRERGRRTAEMLRTWKVLGRKPYAPAETRHCATIWLKLNSGCGCHPARWYFCFKDLLAVKEVLLAIKKPVVFASFLLARFPLPQLLLARSARDQEGPCEGTVLALGIHHASPRLPQTAWCGCSTWYRSQWVFLPLNCRF